MSTQKVEIITGNKKVVKKPRGRFFKYVVGILVIGTIISIVVVVIYYSSKKKAQNLKKRDDKIFEYLNNNIIPINKNVSNNINDNNINRSFEIQNKTDSYDITVGDYISINFVDEQGTIYPLSYCLGCWVGDVCDEQHLCFTNKKTGHSTHWLIERISSEDYVFRNRKNGKLLNVLPQEFTGLNVDICCVDVVDENIDSTHWTVIKHDDESFSFKNNWNGMYLNICTENCVDTNCFVIPQTKKNMMKFYVYKIE